MMWYRPENTDINPGESTIVLLYYFFKYKNMTAYFRFFYDSDILNIALKSPVNHVLTVTRFYVRFQRF